MSAAASGVLEGVRFGDRGLVTAVVQDWKSGEVLMVAHMNAEALAKTVETGIAHYWSRSRGKLWRKGETSGHVQRIKGVYLDCDGDAVLLKVSQKRGACHLGYRSCYFRKWSRGKWREAAEPVFAPEDVYASPKNK